MDGVLRRIVAVEAHRRRSGRCPVLVHALGTGESFEIEPGEDGFRDLASGRLALAHPSGLIVEGAGEIEIRLLGDVGFEGYDHSSAERFSGHAGGGASVTLYGPLRADYFQYAVSDRQEPPDRLLAS